jgi:hypothetical protein
MLTMAMAAFFQLQKSWDDRSQDESSSNLPKHNQRFPICRDDFNFDRDSSWLDIGEFPSGTRVKVEPGNGIERCQRRTGGRAP